MYYHTCPNCGANLDPGERCDLPIPHPWEIPKVEQHGRSADAQS